MGRGFADHAAVILNGLARKVARRAAASENPAVNTLTAEDALMLGWSELLHLDAAAWGSIQGHCSPVNMRSMSMSTEYMSMVTRAGQATHCPPRGRKGGSETEPRDLM